MKQRIILLLIIFAFTINSIAQPILTGADCNMQVGDIFTTRSSQTYLGNTTGANYTWNYSSYDTTFNTISISNVQSSGTTNILLEVTPGTTTETNRYEVLPTVIQLTSTTWSSGSSISYTNKWTKLVYPITMGTTFSDTYNTMAFFSGPVSVNVKGSGTSNGIADGWGTLITPYGTYNNVLRVTTITQLTDTTNNIIYGSGYDTTHSWYVAGVHKPVLTTYSNSKVTGGQAPVYGKKTTFLMTPTSLNNAISDITVQLSIYPNPSNGNFEVNMQGNEEHNVAFKMLDIFGKEIEIHVYPKTTNVYTIENRATQGIYLLALYEKNQLLATRKIVVN